MLTTAAARFAGAAAGEVVALRTIYVFAGVITGLAGLVGLLVLEEPAELPLEEGLAVAEAASD
jgi:hypothetical protein